MPGKDAVGQKKNIWKTEKERSKKPKKSGANGIGKKRNVKQIIFIINDYGLTLSGLGLQLFVGPALARWLLLWHAAVVSCNGVSERKNEIKTPAQVLVAVRWPAGMARGWWVVGGAEGHTYMRKRTCVSVCECRLMNTHPIGMGSRAEVVCQHRPPPTAHRPLWPPRGPFGNNVLPQTPHIHTYWRLCVRMSSLRILFYFTLFSVNFNWLPNMRK